MINIPDTPLIDRFPFPLKVDSYRYSNNSMPLDPPNLIDITPEYFEEMRLKRSLLDSNHHLYFQSLESSVSAQWEIVDLLLDEMTATYPKYFTVNKQGDEWEFHNHLLNEQYTFKYGDSTSLPVEPLDFIGRNIQEDVMYLSQKEETLYLDAGQLCFPGNWSLPFNLGRTFEEIHAPVPSFSSSGMALKTLGFLKRIEAGKPWRRYNWTITAGRILPTNPATFDEWGKMRQEITAENVGELIHMRVEDQKFFRLPYSNGLIFSIRTHLISLNELANRKEWAERFYKVLIDLPDYMASYKGFLPNKHFITDYLKNKINQNEIRF